ncbi:MAG: histidine kinase dimerization/phospho-acceptor domain-containing protein [Xenococcaceae cyanobacterium MO_188.B32]|nr:histidine kinase dimerization/phospho-acceptor domain-containing protein [Xenococcaceae cyanobacterium MO_188.B32]
MVDFFNNLLFSRQYIPHGHCYLWQSGLLWLHVLSDVFIALAYYSIPLLLVYFVRQREDVPFKGIFVLFSLFIFSCGTTHIMSIWTLWHPDYWLSGLIKAITAIISVYTAFELIPAIPRALALRSPTELAAANQALEIEIVNRQRMEETLQKTNQELRKSNEELEQFAYLASHDLREPLRMVTSFTKLLARRYSARLDAEADKIIGLAVDGATRMEELIRENITNNLGLL